MNRANWLFVLDENTSDFWVEIDRPFMVTVRYRTKTIDDEPAPAGFDHAGAFAVCHETETHHIGEGIKCVTYPPLTTHAEIPKVVDRCLAEVIELVNAHADFIGVPEARIPPEANTAGRPGGHRWEEVR